MSDVNVAKKVVAVRVRDLMEVRWGEFYVKRCVQGLREARLKWLREARCALEAKRRGAKRVRVGGRFVVMVEDWVGRLLLLKGLVSEKDVAAMREEEMVRGRVVWAYDVSVIRLRHGEDSRSFSGEELRWRETEGMTRRGCALKRRVRRVYGDSAADAMVGACSAAAMLVSAEWAEEVDGKGDGGR